MRRSRLTRLRNERGAVSVLVAFLSVALIGFAAVSVDVAAMWADRQQLQTGADAAVLAIAQDCADDACGAPRDTAQTYALVNKNDGNATASVHFPDERPNTVEVTTSTVREHWFATIWGIESSQVTAVAAAEWGVPAGGTARLPIIFSECEWYAQTSLEPLSEDAPAQELVIELPKKSEPVEGCNKPVSGNFVPGGFGYVDPLANSCLAETSFDDYATSSTGNKVPTSCNPADFQALVSSGERVLIPLFDEKGDTGGNAWYHVSGYAAFQVTGYMLGGQYKTSPAPCTGEERCIQGYFLEYVDATGDPDLEPDAADFGASVVRLIPPYETAD